MISSAILEAQEASPEATEQGNGPKHFRGRNDAASASSLDTCHWQSRTVLRHSTDPIGSATGRVQLTCGPEHYQVDSSQGAASAPSTTLLSSGCHHNSFAEVRNLRSEISGPCFFPSGFACTETKRKRKKQRSCHLSSGVTPAQVLRRQVKARLRLWKRLREVLIHHRFIPEEEEHTLITLAESEGVKDNEDGLEGWTAFQLMNKVSEGAKDGFEILTQAVEDIMSNLSSKEPRTIQIRSSNITQWRHEVQKWLQTQSDDIILVQETHLTKEGVTSAVSAMHKAGYEMFGGESSPSNKKGTYRRQSPRTSLRPSRLSLSLRCLFQHSLSSQG